ncbi:hypothetical protein [Methanogenium cariaci]|jgi:predicted branched-subunit amino acid permease
MTDKTSSLPELPKHAWVSVPIIAFAGIAIGILSQVNSVGIGGCIISSFILCGIAYLKPKKDLVSLLVPLFAIIIFNPWGEFSTGIIMQTLFAATITVIAIRLEKKYSQKVNYT